MARSTLLASTLACALALSANALAATPAGNVAAGQRVFSRCSSCHQVGAGAASTFGPQLSRIVGRPAGAARDFHYSDAMKGSHLVWTEQNLAAFIRDPGKVVPGTKMRFWGIGDDQQIADLIAYLRSVN